MKLFDNNKKILMVVCLVLVVGVCVLGVSFALNTKSDVLKNQEVDGLIFENAKVEYSNNISTFSAVLYNENDEDIDVESISIKLVDKDGKKHELLTDVSGILQSSEGRHITATIEEDITDMKSIEYVIKKEEN